MPRKISDDERLRSILARSTPERLDTIRGWVDLLIMAKLGPTGQPKRSHRKKSDPQTELKQEAGK